MQTRAMRVQCEPPNGNLVAFDGFIESSAATAAEDATQRAVVVPLDRENVLLRGCVVRNTESVAGVVVYTGHETKVSRPPIFV